MLWTTAALCAVLCRSSSADLGGRSLTTGWQRVRRGGGLPFLSRKKKPAPAEEVVVTTRGAIGKVALWTLAETGLIYGTLAWAAKSDEPNIELAAAIVLVYGSAALSDILIGVTSSALSPPARQVLIPTKVPDASWYEKLPKPPWNPPSWLFPIMWLVICKPAQVVALGRLHSGALTRAPGLVFSLHLALGDAWNRAFFGEKLVGLGALTIYLFLATLVASAALFAQDDQISAALLTPTILWVNIAAALNADIYFRLRSKRAAAAAKLGPKRRR